MAFAFKRPGALNDRSASSSSQSTSSAASQEDVPLGVPDLCDDLEDVGQALKDDFEDPGGPGDPVPDDPKAPGYSPIWHAGYPFHLTLVHMQFGPFTDGPSPWGVALGRLDTWYDAITDSGFSSRWCGNELSPGKDALAPGLYPLLHRCALRGSEQPGPTLWCSLSVQEGGAYYPVVEACASQAQSLVPGAEVKQHAGHRPHDASAAGSTKGVGEGAAGGC